MEPNQPDTTATPGSPDAGGLSPEEAEFFRTGDTSALPASYAPEAPAAEPAAPAVAAPAAPAAPAPAAPAAQPDFARLLDNQQQQFARQMADMQAKLDKALAPPAEQEPDPFTDPIGNQMYKLNKLAVEMEQLRTGLTQRQEQEQQTRTLTEFVNGIKADKDAFAATTPDFPKAYEHIRAIRTEDLRQAGCPEADIPKIIVQDELQFAHAARQRGQNPAQQMYEMAKRYGYAPLAAATTPPVDPQAAAAAQVARLQNGQFAARQPQHAAPAAETLTLANLKDAGQADLDRVVMNPDLWETVVGGRSSGDIFHH